MAKWRFDRTATYDYPSLGFIAEPNDILTATNAPDAWWTSVPDTGQAETVQRYGPVVSTDYVEPADGSALVYNATKNEYEPSTASLPGTYVAFERSDNGAAMTGGHVAVKVDPATYDIVDIVWKAG